MRAPRARALSPRSLLWASDLGFAQVRELKNVCVCSIFPYLYTGGLVIGIDPIGHAGRYCYETVAAATAALASWDGRGDPPGAWIKFKGTGCERLGPGCINDLIV